MMLPGITCSPPYALIPSRLPAESRPLRDEPPAFLLAIARLQLRSESLDQFLDGIISIFVELQLLSLFALGGGLLGARFGRSLLGNRLLGRSLFLCGLGRLVVAIGRCRYDGLLPLRPRSDRRRLVIGQDLGDAQHRDLVAIAALAARILAAALLERDHLGAALVLQHLGGDRGAGDRGGA